MTSLRTAFAVLALSLVLVSCGNDQQTSAPPETSKIVGSWKNESTALGNDIRVFTAEGKMAHYYETSNSTGTYEVKDNKLTITPDAENLQPTIYDIVKLDDNTLHIKHISGFPEFVLKRIN